MNVPFVDLKSQYHSIKAEIDSAIQGVIDNTAFIGGKPVSNFEEAYANHYGVKHCISVGNGTDSLYIVMKMLGIGSGDEVITVANSWISTSETISQTGATPVFIDIDPDYYTINEWLLEEAITENTKLIVPVHLYGQMCNMTEISRIAQKYKVPIMEDCAQSHYAELDGQRAGTFGIAASFSFYPGKNLGAYGDAGCILTNDDDLAMKCRMFARHGALKKHEHQIEGINSRLDGIQAAILQAKLPHILNWTQRRIANAAIYTELLDDVAQVITPATRPSSQHVFHLYVIRAERRDELAAFLKSNGVFTSIHYPKALPNLKAYDYLNYSSEHIPVADQYQNVILSLPMYPELEKEQIEYAVEKIKEFYK